MYIARARNEQIPAMASSGLNACSSYWRNIEFQVFYLTLDSSVVFERALRFQSSFHQSKTICLLSILTLPCARASTVKQHICISPEPGVNQSRQWCQEGCTLAHHRGRLSSFKFCSWSSIAQSVCEQTLSLLAIRCLRRRTSSNPGLTKGR